jgi:hypothetical protein
MLVPYVVPLHHQSVEDKFEGVVDLVNSASNGTSMIKE